jgi:purine-nucleoside phosphorylase
MQVPDKCAVESAGWIRRRWPRAASIGLILGTGAAAVAEALRPECDLAFGDVPHLVPTTSIGHPGRFMGGRIADKYFAILQGRVHLYEGYSPRQVQFPIEVLAALGVRSLVVTNASGGLNPAYRCGDLVVLDDLVDLTFSASDDAMDEHASRNTAPLPPREGLGEGGSGYPARFSWYPDWIRVSDLHLPEGSGYPPQPSPSLSLRGRGAWSPFSRELADTAWALGRRAGFGIQRGTYVGVLGPNYETRAEYRFLRRIADAVGMSTVHEVTAARRLGMRVLGLSVVSNECCPDNLTKTTGESVIRAVEEAADRLTQLIVRTCREL